jgi:hypothetical protein
VIRGARSQVLAIMYSVSVCDRESSGGLFPYIFCVIDTILYEARIFENIRPHLQITNVVKQKSFEMLYSVS